MITRRRACTPLLALALAAGGCDAVSDDADIDDVDIAFRPGSGGILLDSASLGWFRFSELDSGFHHHSLRGVVLVRVCLAKKFLARCLAKIKLVDGKLVGSDDQGSYTGLDLVGSRWDLEFDTPDPVTGEGDGLPDSTASLRLVGRSVVPVAGGGTLELIDLRTDRATVTGPLKATLPAGNEPVPLCAPDPARGGATEAALLGDTSVDHDGSFSARPDTLHIACTSAAIGRARTLGYRPEALGLDAFEGLTRAFRADYCGTGESHATPGNGFAIADVWGIQSTTEPLHEARWSSAGALCLDHARNPTVDAAAIRGACGIPMCDSGPLGSDGEVAMTSLAM